MDRQSYLCNCNNRCRKRPSRPDILHRTSEHLKQFLGIFPILGYASVLHYFVYILNLCVLMSMNFLQRLLFDTYWIQWIVFELFGFVVFVWTRALCQKQNSQIRKQFHKFHACNKRCSNAHTHRSSQVRHKLENLQSDKIDKDLFKDPIRLFGKNIIE